ncbi:MAG: polysaccharide pyruvyl transferase family protein [Sedimentisphaerales bacterium]|nr:polysaccharide pyruvyl transferase family protein [Sedimentisphaerales bacterium]
MISIYQFGTFDVPNYGDLLFPLLAQHRLAALGVNIVAMSPIGGGPVWKDCIPSSGIDTIDCISSPDGVLIGGGNIITLSPTHLPAYNRCPTALLAYPDIWVGACRLAMNDVPVLWNAPGVPEQFSPDKRPFVKECLERSLYVSVRDEQSRDFLLECCPEKEIFVFPDPAWVTTELWENSELFESYEGIFKRRNQKIPERSIVVHLNSRYMSGAANQEIAFLLDETAKKLDARIILVAMGPCHLIDELAREVGKIMRSNPVIIDQPLSLKEVTSCLANATAYIGSSMHGLIISASFAVPGICVTDGKKTKIKGLKQQFNSEDTWFQSWKIAIDQLASMNFEQKKIQLTDITRKMQDRVNEHWKNISDLLQKYINKKHTETDKEACYKQSKIFWKGRTELTAIEALTKISLENRKEREISNLRTIISEKEKANVQYRDELYSVYTSCSWRYTALLRKIGSVVKKILRLPFHERVRSMIKRIYFLIPRQIRCTMIMENLKNRFKNAEIK